MTRKEAAERIKAILKECTADEDAVCYVTSYDADALDMAIKALKQEPCEDCISRQAAIECLEHLSACDEPFVEIGTDDETFIRKYEAITEISDLPSAQPETPMQIGWICPVCGRGLSPLTSVCPCNNGKGWEITC